MKKITLLLIISFTFSLLFSQSFEGIITSKNSFVSKIEAIPDTQWETMMGTKQDYYIKGGNYKSVTNGSLMQWQTYINKDNKLYNKMSNAEIIYWMDCSKNLDEVLSSKLNKNVIEILGYSCDELILNCKSGVQKYYFNNSFSVDVEKYENHLFGNWYDYIKLSKSLPLKAIIENAQFTMESIAVGIEEKKLKNSEFQLPKNMKTEKSPF